MASAIIKTLVRTLRCDGYIMQIWIKYIDTQRHFIEPTLSNLSMNQRKMLKGLANSSHVEALSMKFLSPLKLSASSGQQALDYLQKKGLIQRSIKREYCILDSAIKFFLRKE